jgi:hypothetical protein
VNLGIDQNDAVEQALRSAREAALGDRDPILLKALTGVSAWIASLFLLGFIGAGLQPEEETLIFLGLLTSGLAITLHHKMKGAGIFIQQSTLACMMCGHVLILIGVLAQFDFEEPLLPLAITQTALCAIPIWAFRKAAYRVISLLFAAWIWTYYSVDMDSPWLFRILLTIEVAAFGLLVIRRAKVSSFNYALAIAIGGSLFFLDWIQSSAWRGSFEEALWPSNLILAALVFWIGFTFLKPGQAIHPKILVLFGVLLALSFLSSPGLLFAIALLILGYGLRDHLFLGLGLLSLPLFIVYFYYSLQVSLLAKSGILITSGGLCLFVAWLAQSSAAEVQKDEEAGS